MSAMLIPSPIRTITVGFGFSPISTGTANICYDASLTSNDDTGHGLSMALILCAYITVGRDFHPAPKVSLDLIVIIV